MVTQQHEKMKQTYLWRTMHCTAARNGSLSLCFHTFGPIEHGVPVQLLESMRAWEFRLTSCWLPTHMKTIKWINYSALPDFPNVTGQNGSNLFHGGAVMLRVMTSPFYSHYSSSECVWEKDFWTSLYQVAIPLPATVPRLLHSPRRCCVYDLTPEVAKNEWN